jgi:hypothetical protein
MPVLREGMTPDEFIASINEDFEEFEILEEHNDMPPVGITMSCPEMINAINANFDSSSVALGQTGLIFKESFDNAVSRAEGLKESYPDVTDETGKTVINLADYPDDPSLYLSRMGYLINLSGGQDLIIENVVINGTGVVDGVPNQGGFYIHAPDWNGGNVIMRNVIVKNVNGWGIQIKQCKSIIIENCYCENGNFYAYTLIGEEVVAENLHSKGFPLFLESACGTSIPQTGNQNSTFYMRHVSGTDLLQSIVWYGTGKGFFIDSVFNFVPGYPWPNPEGYLGACGATLNNVSGDTYIEKLLFAKLTLTDPEIGIVVSANPNFGDPYNGYQYPIETLFVTKYTYSNISWGSAYAIWDVMGTYITNLIWKT